MKKFLITFLTVLPKYNSKNNIHKQFSEYAYLVSTDLNANIPDDLVVLPIEYI